MTGQDPSSPLPQLEPELVDAIRVLFDILDTERAGYVSYEKLSAQFASTIQPLQLPPHFLGCAAKVTSSNGYLSFERFLSAVQLSLKRELNNNSGSSSSSNESGGRAHYRKQSQQKGGARFLHRFASDGRLHQSHLDSRPESLSEDEEFGSRGLVFPACTASSSSSVGRSLKARNGRPLMGVAGYYGQQHRRSMYASQPAINQMSSGAYEERFVGAGTGGGSRANGRRACEEPAGGGAGERGGERGASARPSPPTYANFTQVVMRQKKPQTVRSQKEEYLRNRQSATLLTTTSATGVMNAHSSSGVAQRAPLAAHSASSQAPQHAQRFRPVSINSYNSLASSGLENIQWRNSTMSNGSHHHNGGGGNGMADLARRGAIPDEDVAPRVAKLERLHVEEEDLVRRGMEKATRLVDWYGARLESIDKRRRLLNKGVVALDPSVPEQRLNFLRAHVTELNRRATDLMDSSEKGFPSHANLTTRTTASTPPKRENVDLESHVEALEQQNRMLSQELIDKTRQLEQLKREAATSYPCSSSSTSASSCSPTIVTRVQPMRNVRPSAFVRPAPHHQTPHVDSTSPIKVYDTLM